jgi:hypothetical protein
MGRPMTTATTLRNANASTEVERLHEGIPDRAGPADSELGTQMALAKLGALFEHRPA